MKNIPLILCAALVCNLVSSCKNTSLSDPNGSGHGQDLSLYELTGQNAQRAVTEADIAAARSGKGRAGTLPSAGAKILLVQSGAHQPDEELQSAYAPHCKPVLWDGRAPSFDESTRGSHRHFDSDKKEPVLAGETGRRLRLVAAQQGCSHVVVVFGEIQSEYQKLPTSAVSWVPVVGGLVPDRRSGTRLSAQALVMETGSQNYTIVSARPQQATGVTTEDGNATIDGRRSLKLKAAAYPDLAKKSFQI